VVTAAGVLVMVVVGVVAVRYTPFWFDPDEGCARLGRCPGPSTDAALRAMWVLESAGLGVVLLGLGLTWRRLRTTPSPPASHPLPAWAEAAAGAVAGVVLCVVPGWIVLLGVLVSPPAVPAALCLFWLAQAATVTALDRHVGPARRSALPGWLAGLVISALALAAMAGWAIEVRGPIGAFPIIAGAVLALGLLVWRVTAWRAGLEPARVWSAAGTAFAVLAIAAGALVWVSSPDGAADRAPPVDLAVPETPLPAPAAPSAAPAAPEPSADPPAPVDAAVACTAAELTWSATGWDAAMGTRAVTVVAVSHTARPCYVDGFAEIAIEQGGRALRLTTEPGSPTGPEVPAARRVGLAEGGAACFPLVWKGYGAAADHGIPQALTVRLPGAAEPSAVPLGAAPAPFDLMDGGTVQVGPWQPYPPL
jgi:uncharacterized protein DUF4232